ncbi:DNA topoisomerase 3 [Fulvia fulva]|uniref:DNA topoisomerase n=1 Tax=Passalora fulva TaxID=5499 RepID=A0A9Q8L4Q8_PASFU|nr:DNA topoisomerase 3 [Fulvia fulva]KAK4634893.1 DNA topoisomerase 3 [Fulvia fulva]KAK4638004.1 DNA topoisomerase 3 [Fulvia fulva]UJO10767.1 DNA topoisomerase 3 [Fulvia fulva]WPV08962.1 DNA topoisomerase 3 [Fulvia fulva]WPV24552.1 DNA topoisomerase 3 [Fulvia fulva]
MPTKVLCVAEKPSIAKAVANHLAGGGRAQPRNINGNVYIKNYEFQYNFPQWGLCDVTMTSVTGHMMEQDFDSQHRGWYSCDPSALFEARIETSVKDQSKAIAKNIEARARYAHYLYIWTDCDREGENIGVEIREAAAKIKPDLKQPGRTVRARFSNIERAHVINAARNPVPLDEAQANAVFARMEIDLRIGACFTRNLSFTVQPVIEKRETISYGSCQFPTLGFVVERYLRVRNFVPETFWGIKVMHEKEGIKVNFKWSRNHLFDRMVVVILFERCLAVRTARVTKVQTKPTSKWKPLPLTTVELQKCGSRFLRMDSQTIMNVAEKLYQSGWISYPRTETDQYDRGMDLQALVQKQTQSQAWGPFAQGLVSGGFSWPRMGRNNDKAHPPIHPVNFVAPTALNQQEQRVYEFVVRRFLACCSADARGSKTEVSISYGSETFNASGLTVLQRNYLDVYPYDKWTSTQELPNFEEGETFVPTEAQIHEGQTSPPGYLTEPELIALMDTNGIGTDATMAEHIAKIKEREYVGTRARTRQPGNNNDAPSDVEPDDDDQPAARGRGRGRGRARGRGRGGRGGANNRGNGGTNGVQEFIPTTLGIALIEGFENMGFDVSLAKPFLRKEMELKMKAISEGRKTRNEVVQETVEQYRAVYMRTQQRLEVLRQAVRKYVLGQEAP